MEEIYYVEDLSDKSYNEAREILNLIFNISTLELVDYLYEVPQGALYFDGYEIQKNI